MSGGWWVMGGVWSVVSGVQCERDVGERRAKGGMGYMTVYEG